MTLKDKLLRKRDKEPPLERQQEPRVLQEKSHLSAPAFTFIRSTTDTEELVVPPTYPGDAPSTAAGEMPEETSKLFSRFRRHASVSKDRARHGNGALPESHTSAAPKPERSFSKRLRKGRNRSSTVGSANLPDDLPEIEETGAAATTGAEKDEKEAQWERRALILAKSNSVSRQSPSSHPPGAENEGGGGGRGVVGERDDDNIQKAIMLHEEGDLERSTLMFGKLADPKGQNNALSQVLYGLALRHGWGCTPDPSLAITYLSHAASNSAKVESLALSAGMKKGGSAKGELVLAIFEMANCFRHGWGVKKDPLAAKQYYETAANLGDTDAMNETAWCYIEGFGTKKDKYKAAQYLRDAESKGAKTVGNQWIWKDKYGGPKKIEPPRPKA